MSSRAAIAGGVLLAFSASGCLHTPVVRDQASACRIARSVLRSPLTPADLVEVTAQFPTANRLARRAYHARIGGIALTAFGAAGLVGAFVTGFVTDTSQPEARIALYSVVGATIALGAAALLTGSIAVKARGRAYAELDAATRATCP